MRCNPQTAQFTYLQYTMQGILIYSCQYATITKTNFYNDYHYRYYVTSGHFHPPPLPPVPYPLAVTPLPSGHPLPLRPRKPLIYFLSLQFCVPWTFHLNRNIQQVTVSGFFHLAPCLQSSSMPQNVSALHPFFWPRHVPLCSSFYLQITHCMERSNCKTV